MITYRDQRLAWSTRLDDDDRGPGRPTGPFARGRTFPATQQSADGTRTKLSRVDCCGDSCSATASEQGPLQGTTPAQAVKNLDTGQYEPDPDSGEPFTGVIRGTRGRRGKGARFQGGGTSRTRDKKQRLWDRR